MGVEEFLGFINKGQDIYSKFERQLGKVEKEDLLCFIIHYKERTLDAIFKRGRVDDTPHVIDDRLIGTLYIDDCPHIKPGYALVVPDWVSVDALLKALPKKETFH